MTKIYHVDAYSGEFTNWTTARLDPKAGAPLVPANAVTVAPPNVGENEIAVWVDGAWKKRPDHRRAEYWLPDGSHHTVTAIGDVPPADALNAPPPVPREEQRAAAISRIDAVHAEYLRTLTGDATVEERGTWKAKEEAARALVAGDATAGQTAMLRAEANGAGITEAALAAKIIAKADGFLSLIGVAAGLRAKARAAVVAVTDDSVPLEDVAASIGGVFVEMDSEVQAALSAFQG